MCKIMGAPPPTVYRTQKSCMLYFLNKIIRVGDNNKNK